MILLISRWLALEVTRARGIPSWTGVGWRRLALDILGAYVGRICELDIRSPVLESRQYLGNVDGQGIRDGPLDEVYWVGNAEGRSVEAAEHLR